VNIRAVNNGKYRQTTEHINKKKILINKDFLGKNENYNFSSE